jgi:eukaryotic-like serine/threonine-protein kinase
VQVSSFNVGHVQRVRVFEPFQVQPKVCNALSAGLELHDGIVLKSPLGQGGMARVWRAASRDMKDVAVKFLSEDFDAMDAMALFEREAIATAKAASPYVVTLYGKLRHFNGHHYVVLECVEGQSLPQLCRDRLPVHTIADLMRQLCTAVSDCHAAGVLHRDIKPQNIMVTTKRDARKVTLIDFGLARLKGLKAIASDAFASGTPFCSSPEQLLSPAENDLRCDVWSLGVVAYCLLTGRAPFTGRSIGSVLRSIGEQNIIPIDFFRKDACASLQLFFRRAFAPKRSARFANVEDFHTAIQGALT